MRLLRALIPAAFLLLGQAVCPAQGTDSDNLRPTVGTGESADFRKVDDEQSESEECKRAKDFLRSRGRKVPKDCSQAIHEASELGMAEYMQERHERMKRNLEDANQRLKEAAEQAKQQSAQSLQRARDEAARKRRASDEELRRTQNHLIHNFVRDLANASSAPSQADATSADSDQPRNSRTIYTSKKEERAHQEQQSLDPLKSHYNATTPLDVLNKMHDVTTAGRVAEEVAQTLIPGWQSKNVFPPEPESLRLARTSANRVQPIAPTGVDLVNAVGAQVRALLQKYFDDAEHPYTRPPIKPPQESLRFR